MEHVILDFESYLDQNVTLKKMGVREYVTHSSFEPFFMALKVPGLDSQIVLAEDIPEILRLLWPTPGEGPTLIAHNVRFDGGVLAWYYGIYPPFYVCTANMARALIRFRTPNGSVSLDSCARHFGLPSKSTFLMRMSGKRMEDLTPAERQSFFDYAKHDADLTSQIYHRLIKRTPTQELLYSDLITRMYLQPQLLVDEHPLHDLIANKKRDRDSLVKASGLSLGQLRSREALAAALQQEGVEPPVKLSVRTGRSTFAMAKTDTDFIRLRGHDNPRVRAIVEARLAASSTIDQTRAERLLELRSRNPDLAVPLVYYGAHTGRLTGDEKINMQNLTRGSALRTALVAPEGYKLVTADLAQIEARLVAWWAGQDNLLEWFRSNQDPYLTFARLLFQDPTLTKESNPESRRVGKVAVLGMGYGVGFARAADMLLNEELVDTQREADRLARDVVTTYRQTFPQVVRAWEKCDKVLRKMLRGKSGVLCSGVDGLVQSFFPESITLPGGMHLDYPHVQSGHGNWNSGVVTYWNGKNNIKLYGAKVFENIIQALARVIIMEQVMPTLQWARPVLQVHDSWTWPIPNDQVDAFKVFVTWLMTTPPSWAPNLPMGVEVKVGDSYE